MRCNWWIINHQKSLFWWTVCCLRNVESFGRMWFKIKSCHNLKNLFQALKESKFFKYYFCFNSRPKTGSVTLMQIKVCIKFVFSLHNMKVRGPEYDKLTQKQSLVDAMKRPWLRNLMAVGSVLFRNENWNTMYWSEFMLFSCAHLGATS